MVNGWYARAYGTVIRGIAATNRDGCGVAAVNCHELIDEIIDVGYVSDKIRAIGCEIESGAVLRFNENLVATAGGALGEMGSSKLKIASLSSSHTNFAFRYFLYGLLAGFGLHVAFWCLSRPWLNSALHPHPPRPNPKP